MKKSLMILAAAVLIASTAGAATLPDVNSNLCQSYLFRTAGQRRAILLRQFSLLVSQLPPARRGPARTALVTAMESLQPGVVAACLALPPGVADLPPAAVSAWDDAMAKVFDFMPDVF